MEQAPNTEESSATKHFYVALRFHWQNNYRFNVQQKSACKPLERVDGAL